MKVAQKPRGTARFRRYELVSVCGIWQWGRHSCLLSPRPFFGVSFFVPYCPFGQAMTGRPGFRLPAGMLTKHLLLLRDYSVKTAVRRGLGIGGAPQPILHYRWHRESRCARGLRDRSRPGIKDIKECQCIRRGYGSAIAAAYCKDHICCVVKRA
jgi:hypothetical protein